MSNGEYISETPVVIRPTGSARLDRDRQHQNAVPYIETLTCLVKAGAVRPEDARIDILHQYLEFREPADDRSPETLTPDRALDSLANLTVGSDEVELLTPDEARAALEALFP